MVKSKEKNTRQKIIETAAHLFHLHGVKGTSVDDILKASKTGKSQFYHYFRSKDRIIREVVTYHLSTILENRRKALLQIRTLDEFEGFIQREIAPKNQDCRGGCPFGTMANEMSESDEVLRKELVGVFNQMEESIALTFSLLQAKGELDETADPESLAQFFISVLQGSMLLSKTGHDPQPMRNAFQHFMSYLRKHVPTPVQTT